MLDPKFVPYLSDEKRKSKHGYEYIVLKDETPKKLYDEYMDFVKKQDKRMKNNELIEYL